MANLSLIDVHAHAIPEIYHEALVEAGETNSAGQVVVDGYAQPEKWSEQAALSFMDENHVAASVLSITAPGVGFLHGQPARRLARALNEELAAMVRRHPHRFGAFAVLPLPDVDAAVEEIAYALDTLGLDGVGLYTNVNGVYLGDPKFEPVLKELDRRSATAFIHPAKPPGTEALGFPSPMLEYPFDTTRMACHLVLSGTLDRYPNAKLILSHGGGTLPFLAERVARLTAHTAPPDKPLSAEHFMKKLRSLYFDLALVSNPGCLAAIRASIPASQLLIGYDFPYAPAQMAPPAWHEFETFEGFSAADREIITSGNADLLFPHLAKRRIHAGK